MKPYLLAIHLLLFGVTASAQSICTDANLRPTNISGSLESLINFTPDPNSRLLIVGEMHYSTDPAVLEKILTLFAEKRETKPCLFLEFSSAVSPYELISKVEDALTNLPAGDSSERKDYSEMLQYYKPLVSTAGRLGLSSFSIDHPKNFGQGMDINERDEAISNRMQILLNNGMCSSAILFIGKAHVTADETGRYTLRQHLVDADLKFTSFNVQHASDPGPPALASWNKLCTKNSLFSPLAPVVLENKLFLEDTPIWPKMINGKWTGGRWRDFDYTILVP